MSKLKLLSKTVQREIAAQQNTVINRLMKKIGARNWQSSDEYCINAGKLIHGDDGSRVFQFKGVDVVKFLPLKVAHVGKYSAQEKVKLDYVVLDYADQIKGSVNDES